MKKYAFRLDMKVRDYECDSQGVVNNAVYLHYLEHARHEFLLTMGVDFAKAVEEGIYLTLVRAEVNYRAPMKSRDRFWVGCNLEQFSETRFLFIQDIYLHPDDHKSLEAKMMGVALNQRRRPVRWKPLIEISQGLRKV